MLLASNRAHYSLVRCCFSADLIRDASVRPSGKWFSLLQTLNYTEALGEELIPYIITKFACTLKHIP